MDLRTSIEQIQSYHDLGRFQNVYPDENIEFGLCRPRNEKLFLTASVAFLHKQLLRRLDDDQHSKCSKFNDQSETNLLLLESETGQEIYISVKNANKFEEAIKQEARVPKNKLSLVQMLPKAKKPKTKFTVFSVLLKGSSHRNLSKKSKSSCNELRPKKTKSILEEYEEQLSNVPSAKIDLFHKFLTSVPSYNSLLNNTNNFNCGSSIQTKNFYRPTSIKSSQISSRDFLQQFQKPARSSIADINALEYLKNIAQTENVSLFDSSKFRRTINRQFIDRENIFKIEDVCGSNREETGENRRIKRSQSKLSVCFEENANDIDSEEDIPVKDETSYHQNAGSLNFNFTDEIKSNINPEMLEMILAKVIKDLHSGNLE